MSGNVFGRDKRMPKDWLKKLGKGYGESLCLQEIFDKSALANKTNFFIAATGRHYIKNINAVINEIKNKKKDIHLCLKDNLLYSEITMFCVVFRSILI